MNRFIQRHGDVVAGVLNGFDRLLIRGTLPWLSHLKGMGQFLGLMGVLWKDFAQYAQQTTALICQATVALAEAAGRPVMHLQRGGVDKEKLAREIAQRDGVSQGLIVVLSAVEPCSTYKVVGQRATRQLELRLVHGQCRHYYFYLWHAAWGFLHVRLQTWFPFTVHICCNGRERLARQMDKAGLHYQQRDNSFVWVENFQRAQALADQQLRTRWPRELDTLLAEVHPSHRQIFARQPVSYYWSVCQSEWATDVLFRSPQALAGLYPQWIRHGILHLNSRDAMRFLGRKLPASGRLPGNFTGEVITDLRERPEGLRIRHRVKRNAIKMYDKQGCILRIETTLNDPTDFKVYRPHRDDPEGPKQWRPLRKSLADLHRRALVCEQANQRYLESLASVEESASLAQLSQTVCRPTRLNDRPVRGLNPLNPQDGQLLEAINSGDFLLNGLRNRDLRVGLFGETSDPQQRRRQAAMVTRQLRMLRAHGILQKVCKTHRYQLTVKGRTILTAWMAARQASPEKLILTAVA